jgi:hypothetical protein
VAKLSTLVHSWNAGEVSIDALARIDQEKLRLAAQVQENILPFTIGKGMMRPGTQYLGASSGNNQARGIPFLKSINPVAMAGLELTDATLRVWVGDALVTRPSVSSAITGGTFPNSTGWTTTATGGGSAVFSGSLVLSLPNRGGTIAVDQQVTVAGGDQNVRHALRVVVGWGPVTFQIGSTQGGSEYLATTALDTGTHSLSFVPTGNFWVRFSTAREVSCTITSIAVESAGVMSLPAPWATAELRQIQFCQSADVMFLTHANWQQRRIERRGDNSWSLVLFKADDGPFALPGVVDASISITPGAVYGNTTLTASGPLFQASDVQSIIRVDSAGYSGTYALAAVGVFSEPIRIFGITPATKFTLNITGTWVGTLTLYQSVTGPNSGYFDSGNSWTTNQTNLVLDPGSAYNNVVIWYKIGFSAYTSGAANVQLSNGATTGGGGLGGVITRGGGGGLFGIYRVTGYTSPTVVSVEVLTNPTSAAASSSWRRGQWSGTRGWPSGTVFHDGRLWFGGQSLPAGSVSDNYTSFATEEADTAGNLSVTADSSIQRTIATNGSVYTVNWMVSLMRLVAGTDGAEVSARADAFDAPLTPTAMQLKNSSTIGSNQVSPVYLDKRAIFVNPYGTKLMELAYSVSEYDYDSDDLNKLNTDIGLAGFVEISVQRHPEPLICAVRADGVVAVLLRNVKDQVTGWVKVLSQAAAGVVESAYVLPGTVSDGQERLYLWIKRTINGSTVRYLEKMCLNSEALGGTVSKLLDAGTFFAGPASTVSVPQLAGQTVLAWGNGIQLGTFTADGSGNVSLGVSATNIWVGLPYTGRYQSAKLAYGAQGGTALLQKKVVEQIGILASNILPSGVRYGKDFTSLSGDGTAMWPLPAPGLGTNVGGATAVQAVLDEDSFPFDQSWDTDARVCLQVSPNTPATFNGLVVSIKTNEG